MVALSCLLGLAAPLRARRACLAIARLMRPNVIKSSAPSRNHRVRDSRWPRGRFRAAMHRTCTLHIGTHMSTHTTAEPTNCAKASRARRKSSLDIKIRPNHELARGGRALDFVVVSARLLVRRLRLRGLEGDVEGRGA